MLIFLSTVKVRKPALEKRHLGWGECKGQQLSPFSLQRRDLRWFNLQMRLLSKTYSVHYVYDIDQKDMQEIVLVCVEREGGIQA